MSDNVNNGNGTNNTNTSDRKNSFLNLSIIITLFSFLALAVMIGGSVVYFQYLRYRDDAKTSKIDIDGTAEKKVKYDKLTMSFTVSKIGTDSSELNKMVDDLTVKSQAILDKNGIKKENIQTVKNSYPDYSDIYTNIEPKNPENVDNVDTGKAKKTVFENRFTIKIEDLQNNLAIPNTITKELTALGVDRFDSYQYEVADEKAVCDDLKTLAIADAREKGLKQIKAIGGKEIVSTQILAGGDNCAGLMYPIAYALADKAVAGSIPGAPNTTPEVVTGEKNIRQQVSVTFEYR